MIRVHIIISGLVQGIGFRFFIKQKADELGLTGWVRNMPNGNVEAVFQGPKAKVKEAVAACREGLPLSQVENLEVRWQEASHEFTGFTVV